MREREPHQENENENENIMADQEEARFLPSLTHPLHYVLVLAVQFIHFFITFMFSFSFFHTQINTTQTYDDNSRILFECHYWCGNIYYYFPFIQYLNFLVCFDIYSR